MHRFVPRRVSVVSLVTAVFLACASTATIQRGDGPDNEAEIERSDADAIYVRGSNGQLYRIERNRVGVIDHPGNVNMIVGACLAGLAVLYSVAPPKNATRQDRIGVPIVYGAPGLGLFLGGTFVYMRSKGAAQAFESAIPSLPAPRPAPVAAPPPPPPPPPDAGADASGG